MGALKGGQKHFFSELNPSLGGTRDREVNGMSLGIVLIVLAVFCYFGNVLLIRHYINKRASGLLELDEALPKPGPNEEYLWEKTAGTGMVPKWVSAIGLLAFPLGILGIMIVIVSFLR